MGHREKAWVKNCIAIGLAGSFIEPLESTGLYLSDLATVLLAEHFPYHGEMDAMAFRFNRIMTNRFYEILDFINMHFCLTRRSDTAYWREVQKDERINDRLKAKLAFWHHKAPSAADFEDQFFPGQSLAPLPSSDFPGDHRSPIDTAGLWGYESYEAILYGMDYLSEECHAWYGDKRPNPSVPRQLIEALQRAPKALPPHHIWLQHVVGMAEYPVSKKGGRI